MVCVPVELRCGGEGSGAAPVGRTWASDPSLLSRSCCHVAAGAYALQPPGWRKRQRCCRFRRRGGRAGRTETQPRGSPSRREAAELCSVPVVDSASRRDSEWAPPPCPPRASGHTLPSCHSPSLHPALRTAPCLAGGLSVLVGGHSRDQAFRRRFCLVLRLVETHRRQSTC